MPAPTRALFLLCGLVASNAHAQTTSAEMVEKGVQLRREHRDAEALEQFRQADKLNPAPRIKAQIGLAEQALAQWVEAEMDLQQALAAAQDPWIVGHADALRTAITAIQQHLASLSIETNAPGAELWVNGLRAGNLPMPPLRVVGGTVNVEIRAKGFESMQKSIAAEPGKTLTERIVLTPSAAAPSETTQPVLTTFVEQPGDASPPPSTMRFMAWGAVTAAGAFLGSAVVAEIMREANAASYNDDAICFKPGLGSRDKQCGEYRGRAESAQTIATVGFVAAGTLGLASVVLFVADPAGAGKTSGIRIETPPGGLVVGWNREF